VFGSSRQRQPPQPDSKQLAVETAWKIHAAIVDWTGKVDTKASFALALESAAIAGVVSLTATGRRLSGLSGFWMLGSFWGGSVCLLLAALLAATVVAPRLRTAAAKKEWPDNFIYFGHLRHWKAADLSRALVERDVLPVLSRQLVVMSQVAWRKHRRVQASLILAIIGAGLIFTVAVTR
jgi:Pycsar effector protein